MEAFKHHDQLVKDNPSGMKTLDNPHNFSSNPGFMSTGGMLGASTPAGGGVIRGTSARGSVQGSPARPTGSFNTNSGGSRPVGNPARPVGRFNEG
jgi:hypothetical protein